jgi:hypothetical protein
LSGRLKISEDCELHAYPRADFCVVLRDSDRWQVEAEWPDGTIEPIDLFKDCFEALKCARSQSAARLKQQRQKRADPGLLG